MDEETFSENEFNLSEYALVPKVENLVDKVEISKSQKSANFDKNDPTN